MRRGSLLFLFYFFFMAGLFASASDSSRNGKYEWYYENGKLHISGIYTDGLRSGTWKEFDTDGNLQRKTKYRRGAVKWVYLYKEGRITATIDRKGRIHKRKDCGC